MSGEHLEMGEAESPLLTRLVDTLSSVAARVDDLNDRLDAFIGSVGAESRSLTGIRGRHYSEDRSVTPIRNTHPPLPDPRLIRRIIRHRQIRTRFFGAQLFADPAWDMLLDLTAARAEHSRVSVTSLCIASGIPPTTALRWIGVLVGAGLLCRVEDEIDHRRAFIALTDKGANAVAQYFAAVGEGSAL